MKRYIRSSELLSSNMEFDYVQLDTKLHDLLIQISDCISKKFNSIEFHYEYKSKIIETPWPIFLATLYARPKDPKVFELKIYQERKEELFYIQADIDNKYVDKEFRVKIICGASVIFESNIKILVDYESKIQKFNKGGFDKKIQSVYNKVIKKADNIASKMNWKLKENYQYNLVEPSKEHNKENSWIELIKNLRADLDNYVDPLYEQTSAGDELESLCAAVQRKLGVWLEPSIQGGIGSIRFYSTKDDSVLADDYDYQEYNEEVLNLAFNSKTQKEFQTKYRQFLQSII